MLSRVVNLATACGFAIVLTTASCAPQSDVERTRDHLGQARGGLVRSLATLADDIERNLGDVETRLADPTMRPEDKTQLLDARARLVAASDKAAASTARQLEREDLSPEDRESLLATQTQLADLRMRLDMSAPIDGTRAIQERLAELGYRPGPVDGIMGPRTRAAIRNFQRDNGLPQTGEASPELIAALTSAQPRAAAR